MAKKTALLGMLVALAFVLSYIETLIPINLGIPGAKLGLANLVVMVATAVFNMPLAEGMEFVNQLDGVGAMWILEDGSIQYSDGFEEYTR